MSVDLDLLAENMKIRAFLRRLPPGERVYRRIILAKGLSWRALSGLKWAKPEIACAAPQTLHGHSGLSGMPLADTEGPLGGTGCQLTSTGELLTDSGCPLVGAGDPL